MLLLEELVNINKRTWDYEDITYWTNPKDSTCNATIIFNGKKSRLRAGIIILNDNEILLGEEADEPGVFSLPGGGLEENETPLQAAIREAQEEVYINVKEAVDTKFDYCECHNEVKDWVKENVPEEEWWYNYYTCLIIAKYDGKYTGDVDKVDQDKSMKSTAKWYKINEVINDPSFKTQWKKAIEAYKTHPLDEELSEIIAYHWSPKSFDNIKPNYQGIHLSTTIETCKDLATNRGLDFKKGNLYKYILDAKNLKPASFDIDILDWSANEIAILLINKIKNKNVYGATFGTDEEGNNWKDNVDNSVVNIDNLNYADLDTLEKIRATQDKKLALKLLVQFLKEKNYNCIKYANFGESSRGDICYILFDNKLILSGTRIDPKTLPEKYSKADYHCYTYDGPVYRFSTYMGNLKLKTMAVSLAKAINNLKFQAAKAYGYDRSAGANFKIKEEKVKVLGEKDINYKDIDFTDIDPASIEDSKIKYCQTCGTRLNDAGECPVCDLGDEEVLKYESLLEDTRAQLANASKKAGEYKNKERGKNRWERKKYSKVSTQVKSYNQINMNEFFKQDILQIKIPVQGETDEYTVTIKLEGVVEEIARHIKQHNNQFEFKTVLQSLTKVFNTKNVYVKCTCEDFQYRFAHWSIINNYSVDDTSKDPGPGRGITNPNNDKGKGCKHILLCIANGSWIMKVSSVIMNYCNYAAEHMKKPFLKLIFPKLYGIPADDAIEDNLVPEDTNLETDTNLIDTINQWAKDRGKFKKGSNKNPITGTGGRKKKEKESEESQK